LLATKEVSAVYSSDLRRARSTAEIIAAELDCALHTDARLRERSFGQLEGSPSESLPSDSIGISRGRVTDVGAHPVGGESIDQLADRCADFLAWLADHEPLGDLVIVAHGGSIRLLQAILTGTDPAGMAWSPVANASVHRMVVPALGPLGRLHPVLPDIPSVPLVQHAVPRPATHPVPHVVEQGGTR
jgi:probable phosphoglycerate mutase